MAAMKTCKVDKTIMRVNEGAQNFINERMKNMQLILMQSFKKI
jgi:hypothetical protein